MLGVITRTARHRARTNPQSHFIFNNFAQLVYQSFILLWQSQYLFCSRVLDWEAGGVYQGPLAPF